MKYISKLNGAATDSISLIFVKIITAMLGIVTTKIMSTQLSLTDYGTYSQGMLIVTTAANFSILGLTDATSFFYNSSKNTLEKEKYIGTIFGIQCIIGSIVALIIILFNPFIIHYFKNEEIQNIIYIVAILPMTTNLLPMLQVLFISTGKARLIAARNFIVSLCRLTFVTIACYFTNNLLLLFLLIWILDVVQVIYFYYILNKNKIRIKIQTFDRKIIKRIFNFSIPMAITVFTTSFSRDIDKYVISYFTDTDTLALYSNAAKNLPFDMIATSFLTVLIPIVTRQLTNSDFNKAQILLKSYLRIGYLSTFPFVIGAIVNAKSMMIFLYDEKYLPALSIFVIYLFSDMVRFANTALILSAKGRTKLLMVCSIVSLLVNAVLNVVAYNIFGLVGPAITTLLVNIGLTIAYLLFSARELNTRLVNLFNTKEIIIILAETLIIGFGGVLLRDCLSGLISARIVVLIITYCTIIISFMAINYKRIIECLKTINTLK